MRCSVIETRPACHPDDMPNIIDLGERAVEALVTRISGPVAAALAVFLYAGIGLALPLALHTSVGGLVELNIVGTSLAGLVILAWLAVRVEGGRRRHLVEWTTDIRLLDSTEFEWLVGEVFRREGWTVRETGRSDAPDRNIDLDLSLNGKRHIVQCKRWQSWQVGVDEIREFMGTLLREGLTGPEGIFVTLRGYTTQARTEAEQAGVTLLDGSELFARVVNVRRPEPCPDCQRPLVRTTGGAHRQARSRGLRVHRPRRRRAAQRQLPHAVLQRGNKARWPLGLRSSRTAPYRGEYRHLVGRLAIA